jgi:peptidoglycan/LPS O-acetylase OafA/YrhL
MNWVNPTVAMYRQRAKQEITDLTCCRAIFAAWVFAYHIDLYVNFSADLGPFASFIRRGYLGVDGFFILSGLLLVRVHEEMTRQVMSPWRFWGKRLARIYPVHFVTLMLLAALVWGGHGLGFVPRDPARFSVPAFFENLFLVQSWGFGGHWAWNYPSWSVSSEWAGYILFPAIALMVGYFEFWVMIQLVVIALPVLGLIIYEHNGNLNIDFAASLWRFFPEFMAGAATATLIPRYADLSPIPIYLSAAFGFIAGGLFFHYDLISAVGLWLLITTLTMQADSERSSLLPVPPLRWLGTLSYSFYMGFATIELLVTQLFRRAGWSIAGHGLVFSTLFAGCTFCLACVLFYTVERPCRRVADRWLAEPESIT